MEGSKKLRTIPDNIVLLHIINTTIKQGRKAAYNNSHDIYHIDAKLITHENT